MELSVIETVTMEEIDAERVKANKLLEKLRESDPPLWCCKEEYDALLLRIERMLATYRKEHNL